MLRHLTLPGLVLGLAFLCVGRAAASEDLVARWERADAACGLPSSAMSEQACLDRQILAERLRRAGWCEAAPTSPYEHWGWQRCRSRTAVRPAHPRRGSRAKA
ncbi:hypothetical protein M446_0301 [Methylobacterium sp. 4-46]|uniref:hypothetical protein n=1 Tax=unclassified Methylobacterium TaxID=2615210 RepID=UPI000165C572|nr:MULTISPECIES: hypothetical protein [Methylobacterium]ACA14872.1 hypothetical protein M446_0301 [Methylobacterium sp. 4-46]WFT80613.1 hypothetical protein QA634_01520 [Methylobacterium nodulans]